MLKIACTTLISLASFAAYGANWEVDFLEPQNKTFETNQSPREISPALENAIDHRSSGTIRITQRAFRFGKATDNFTFFVVAKKKAWATHDHALRTEVFSSSRVGGPYVIKVSGKLKVIIAALEANIKDVEYVKSDSVGWFDTMSHNVQKAVILLLANQIVVKKDMLNSIISRRARYASLKANEFGIEDRSGYGYSDSAFQEQGNFAIPKIITDQFRQIWVNDELRKLHGANFHAYLDRSPKEMPAGRLKAFFRSAWFVPMILAENSDQWNDMRGRLRSQIADGATFSDLRGFLDKKAQELVSKNAGESNRMVDGSTSGSSCPEALQ